MQPDDKLNRQEPASSDEASEARQGSDRGNDIRMTMVEQDDDDEDIRSTMAVGDAAIDQGPLSGVLGRASPGVGSDPASTVSAISRRPAGKLVQGRARRYRPSVRPPMAVLLILDDDQVSAIKSGDVSGECVRIRSPSCIIGRTTGDIVIPHEVQMSGRHAEIFLRLEVKGYRWYLRDLGSTNGTFVRADQFRLKDGDEILVGSRRFRFVQEPGAARAQPGGVGPEQTDTPALVELTLGGHGNRIALEGREHWIGRDPVACPRFLWDDPVLDQQHAKLFRDATGRWCVKDEKSLNGVWARVSRVRLANSCWFQLGEQQFRFFIP